MTSSIPTLPEIQQGIDAVEKLMLSQADGYHSDLKSALSVLLSSGGKRIRPRIILLLGSIFNAKKETLITLATSIELLHTATLVHDDLIDGSLLRRGVPTLNAKWSPAATVLTGDFLFACAANLAAKTNSIEVMSLFSKTLMTIVNGEVNQLFSSRCSPIRDDYYRRIYAKTASLFETSTQTAAIISQVTDQQTEIIRKFGYELGMAFQIVDDVLDYSGDQTIVGKPVGGDLRQGLITLPMLYFIQNNPHDKNVIDLIHGKCIQDEETIQYLVHEVSKGPSIDLALKEAEQFAKRALNYITELPSSPEKDELIQLTTFSVMRKK
ncbi:MAG: polyprenyl synthetase family protein [Chloroflexi bacterium]|nr:polyprenyl synthetase family protein [Chloroflexota bacterium]